MKTEEAILEKVAAILAEEFELEKSEITMNVNLYQDLGLDSIDAVDLIVKIQDLVGRRVDPETFKKVRTVSDVVVTIQNLLR